MQYYRLKELLDNLYITYRHKYSSKDPVWILHRFSNDNDIELIGLITAAYAYGSVDQINSFIELFLKRISFKPYEFIINFSKHKDKKYFEGLYYRFNTEADLVKLIGGLNRILSVYGSLQNLFMNGFNQNDGNILNALGNFSREINNGHKIKVGNYFHYLISNPAGGSVAKRMNLFLRWMVRNDEIDLGIWDKIPASKLIIPVDTHIARVSKKLKLVERKSIDLKFAIELTDKLKKFDPNDPVKYDFALCHIGIDKKSVVIPGS